jgi:hypothetical protein
MPLDEHLGKQGCNCLFRDHKIFNPCKNRSSTFAIQFHLCSIAISSASLSIASLSFVIYLLSFIVLPVVSYLHLFILLDHSKFTSVSFVRSDSFYYLLYDYSVLFSVLILKMYSKYFDLHNNNHRARQHTSNHKTAPSFVLV